MAWAKTQERPIRAKNWESIQIIVAEMLAQARDSIKPSAHSVGLVASFTACIETWVEVLATCGKALILTPRTSR